MQTILYSGGSGVTNAPIANLATDRARIWLPKDWKKNGTKRAVQVAFGSGDGFPIVYDPVLVTFATDLVNAGYGVAMSPYGGSLFGNATAQSRMAALRTFLVGTLGARTRVALVGFSMGGGGSLAFAGNNPTLVSSVFGFNPLTDLAAFASDPTVTAAYPPSGYVEATYGAQSNPKTQATAGKFAGMDVRVGYTIGDTVITQASVEAFGTQIGRPALNLGNATHTFNNFALPSVRANVLAQLAATDGVN